MSKFFERVATPEIGMQQSAAPNGPTVDANARAEAQNDINNNLGSALQDLIGSAGAIASIKENYDRQEMAKMRAENDLDAESDLANIGSYIVSGVDSLAEDKNITDYTPEELKSAVDKMSSRYIKEKGLENKGYFKLIQEKIKEKSKVLLDKQYKTNEKVQKEKKYGVLMNSVKSVFDVSADPSTVVGQLQDKLDQNVGLDTKVINVDGKDVEFTPAINDTEENAKMRMLQPILESVMANRDPKAMRLLESKEFKEFFDFPDYDNVISAGKQQVQSTINKNRQMSYDKMEESAYFTMDAGMFKSTKDVKAFMKESLENIKEEDRPETKSIIRLESNLLKSFETEDIFQKNIEALKKNDFTVLERSGLKEKEVKAVKNKFFAVETGIDDLSPDGITTALTSGSNDSQIKKYLSEGYPWAPDLVSWANTPPSGGLDGIRKKRDAVIQLTALTQDTPTTVLDLFTPKEYSRMMFSNTLIDNIDSKTLDESNAYQVYSSFNNDLEKNVDSFGHFTSVKASAALSEESVEKWLSNKKSDAPWTYDEFSSQAYRERQFKNYFSYAMETTPDIDKAMELAENMFESRHVEFENPDGSEGTLPSEFKSYAVKDFVSVARNLDAFQSIKEGASFLGLAKDYSFDRNLSFKPDPSYEKNKLMNFFYDGSFITSLDVKKMSNKLKEIGEIKKNAAELRNIKKTQSNK
jgi:hypothetical protein